MTRPSVAASALIVTFVPGRFALIVSGAATSVPFTSSWSVPVKPAPDSFSLLRLKLAAEHTATARHERTLYVLDEPTTGLHLADVSKLVSVLGRLVERGDTLVVIEHHPLVMASADHLIELGPDGGNRGGRIVAEGLPRAVAKKKTATGAVLKELFESS